MLGCFISNEKKNNCEKQAEIRTILHRYLSSNYLLKLTCIFNAPKIKELFFKTGNRFYKENDLFSDLSGDVLTNFLHRCGRFDKCLVSF